MKKIIILLLIVGTFSFCTKEKVTKRAERNNCRDCRLKMEDIANPSDTAYYLYPNDYTSDTYIDQGYWCALLDTIKDNDYANYTVECFYK